MNFIENEMKITCLKYLIYFQSIDITLHAYYRRRPTADRHKLIDHVYIVEIIHYTHVNYIHYIASYICEAIMT